MDRHNYGMLIMYRRNQNIQQQSDSIDMILDGHYIIYGDEN